MKKDDQFGFGNLPWTGSLAWVIFNFLKAIPGWDVNTFLINFDIIQDIIDGNGIFFKHSYGDGKQYFEFFGYINFKDKFFTIDICEDALNSELISYLFRKSRKC